MKKYHIVLCVIALLFFSIRSAEAAPAIRITSPNGGENLIAGETYRITWDSENVDKVTIGYTTGPGNLNWLAGNSANNIPNTGYYDWKVSVGNTTNTKFKIDIMGYQTGTGSVNDQSDDFFTVSNPAETDTSSTVPDEQTPSEPVFKNISITSQPPSKVKNGETFEVSWKKPNVTFDKYIIGWENQLFEGSISSDSPEGIEADKKTTTKAFTGQCGLVDSYYTLSKALSRGYSKEKIAKNFFIRIYTERIQGKNTTIHAKGKTKKIELVCDGDQALPANGVSTTQVSQTKPNSASVSPEPTKAYPFDMNLAAGMYADQVRELQRYLNAKGFTVAKTGTGSPGQESLYFGPATQAALIKFQVAHNIQPAAGYFGPLTRQFILAQIQ